jgi:hypothetical protein
MSERVSAEVNEQERLKELQGKFEKLYSWAKDQTFVTVYRAEGTHDQKLQRSAIGSDGGNAVGTWFTPSYEFATKRFKPLVEQGGGQARIIAVTIAQADLDGRDSIQKGMQEVNVINKDILASAEDVASEKTVEPTLENFLQQFAFVREYESLKKKYGIE